MTENLNSMDWLPLGNRVRLVGSHPCGLIALEKPAKILSHPNTDDPGEKTRSLLNADYDLERECYHRFPSEAAPKEVFLLHRLDSATSGVLLLATNPEIAEAVQARFRAHDVEKTYLAICRGRGGPGMHGLWIDPMEKVQEQQGGPVRAMKGMVAEARTRYWWERADSYRFGFCLMRLTPITGRTHQLRFQCAQHDMPIVGDRIYGSYRLNHLVTKATNNKRLYLHSAHIKLKFPYRGEVVRFGAESPLPERFNGLLGQNEEWVRALTYEPTAKAIIERQRAKVRVSLRSPHSRKPKQSRSPRKP